MSDAAAATPGTRVPEQQCRWSRALGLVLATPRPASLLSLPRTIRGILPRNVRILDTSLRLIKINKCSISQTFSTKCQTNEQTNWNNLCFINFINKIFTAMNEGIVNLFT